MNELLPYYERELAFLRGRAGEFAERHPKIAGRLQLGGDAGTDPHVERLVESFAFLASRIHKRLDDDFPLFTESLLEVLYPHYLRPFPSCSIAQFRPEPGASAPSAAVHIGRGTMLDSRPVQGVACRFRTAYGVDLLPVRLASVAFRRTVGAPEAARLPRTATALLSLRFELTSAQANWGAIGVESLRLHLHGDASQVSALREALCGRAVATFVQTDDAARWVACEALPRTVGFAAEEALIDFDARSHPAYRLLTEFFAFPEKFDFVDLPLPAAVRDSDARAVTLHIPLQALHADSDEARLLQTVSEKNLLLGCTPVVNLFGQRAEPIRVTHASERYTVLADGRRAFAYEVAAIDRVWCMRRSPEGEALVEFRPFHSLRHDQLVAEGEASAGRYWYAHRDATLAEISPGRETEIGIVDMRFDPVAVQADTLSIELRVTNRDLPTRLSVGNPGGDLFAVGGDAVHEITLLRKPTPSRRFERGRGALWRLISHLSLNHLSLSAGGVEALRELLRLYDLPGSAGNRRQIEGLVAVDYKPAHACLPGNPFPAFVRGTEIRLTVDEQAFAGSGLCLFTEVLDRFFGLYVHANGFTQLKVHSARTREELIACPCRSGDAPLV